MSLQLRLVLCPPTSQTELYNLLFSLFFLFFFFFQFWLPFL